jgi:hypothetical protein
MKKQPLLILMFMSCMAIRGQSIPLQAIATAGGNGQNSEVAVAWILGEPFVATFSAGNSVLTQGFLQPTLVVTAISGLEGLSESINAYPNPSQDVLIIQMDNNELKDMQYMFFDLNGRLLEKNRLIKTHTAIDMTNYPAGVYLLKITQPDKILKTFEIIKHQN